MKRLQKLLMLLCLCALLLPSLVTPAYAGDLDYIDEYHVTVTPNTEDGSLHIEARFRWTVLEEGPVEWLQIGIPNGSIREETALTDNIGSLAYDNSYMYVYFNRGYDDGETFEFAYSWVQEYMYTLADGTMVSYDYTPGWFDEAEIGLMTLTWLGAEGAAAEFYPTYSGGEGELVTEPLADGGFRLTGENLSHGATMTLTAQYATWPTELYWENSAENMPVYDDWDDEYWEDDFYYEDDYSSDAEDIGMIFTVIFIIIVIIVIKAAIRGDGYAGGFGTRYVLYHGLWYPMGRDGRPRPGSVGTKHKPKPPQSRGGGFGGGSRGGGFGGGGFSGGSRCACASSCACACACACAGGGRAGCSAKNLYGAVKLDKDVTASLEKEQ